MSLIALVDNGGGCLEACPDAFTELLGHGAEFLPLLVKLLQLVESRDYIVVGGKLLGGFAEFFLGLEILLEVEVAELAVDFDLVVETLYIELISAVYIPEGRCGHRPHILPAILDFAESGESGRHIVAAVHQGLEFFDNGLFLFEVFFLKRILLLVVLGPLALVVGINALEVFFNGVESVTHFRCFAFEFAKKFVECGLDGFGLLAAGHAVGAFHQESEYI